MSDRRREDRWRDERRDRSRERGRDERDRRPGGGRERRDGGGEPPRPRPSGGLPPRAPSNPLMAEAYRLAKEKQQQQQRERESQGGAVAAGSDDDEPVERPPSRGWRAAAEDEGELPEDGELPQAAPGPAPAPSPSPPPSGKKRKHAPIVWHTPPKAARGELPHVGSSKGLEGLAAGAGGGAAPRSAADRAMEEVLAFQAQQLGTEGGGEAAEDDGQPYMKPSPSVSSEEEGEEGGAAQREPRSSSGSPAGRGAGTAAAAGDEEAQTAPSAQPKRASRWTAEEEAAGNEAQQAVAAAEAAAEPVAQRGAPSVDPGWDAEQLGEDQGAAEGNPDELSPRQAKRCVNMLDECRSVDNYEKLNRISEGTYGVVYRARDRESGEICALKKVKLEKERDGFPLTSIREINILLSLNHPHIVNVSEVVVGPSLDAVFMVMEYCDHDLKAVMEERMTQPFSIAEVKTLMLQLLSGMAYLHDNWVLHRDLKTSNILYTNRGELKLCDFGLARQYGSPLAPYTHMVVTLWYRAPELLLGQRKYSTAVDVWSIGCIMAELLSKEALFAGKSEIDQLQLILKTMGSPTEETWPGVSKLPHAKKFNLGKYPSGNLRQRFPPPGLGFDGRPSLSEQGFHLLSSLLELCPERRISCEEALEHPWFREHPLPKDRALMPTFPATNDQTQQRYAAARARASAKGAG
ncbi:hypothetical protein ABPG75_014032 [Micractinium tetrahymenae]